MIRVRVPATTANVGPGFDTMGIALSLYNTFYVSASERLEISGCDAEFSNAGNLFYVAYKKACEIMGLAAPEIKLRIDAEIPITRGLGSSAAMIVGGVCASVILARGEGFDLVRDRRGKFSLDEGEREKILGISASLEGHPDNVSPAIFGGYRVSITEDSVDGKVPAISSSGFAVDDTLRFNALVPSFRLETKKARAVLPANVSRQDAVFTAGHAALTALAFAERKYELLAAACKDRLHQPYRRTLIPGWDEILSACELSGALAVWLSGAGPTIMALARNDSEPMYRSIDSALKVVGEKTGDDWRRLCLNPDNDGLRVEAL